MHAQLSKAAPIGLNAKLAVLSDLVSSLVVMKIFLAPEFCYGD